MQFWTALNYFHTPHSNGEYGGGKWRRRVERKRERERHLLLLGCHGCQLALTRDPLMLLLLKLFFAERRQPSSDSHSLFFALRCRCSPDVLFPWCVMRASLLTLLCYYACQHNTNTQALAHLHTLTRVEPAYFGNYSSSSLFFFWIGQELIASIRYQSDRST